MPPNDPMKAIHHVVHEYANFISSAEMVLGADTSGAVLTAPANTHVAHAFYLNCRKMADFLQNRKDGDDVMAEHFIPGFTASLTEYELRRRTLNKQLAHISYRRDSPEEITPAQQLALHDEIRKGWGEFRRQLQGGKYQTEFTEQVRIRQAPDAKGEPSEFRYYDLD